MTSVANTLLIAAQKPEASYVMSYDDWTQKGRSVKRGENGFFILEANGEYTREDGSLATSYDAKCVFDILHYPNETLIGLCFVIIPMLCLWSR